MKTDKISASKRMLSYAAVAIVCLALGSLLQPLAQLQSLARGQASCRTFQETGKTVCGRFLEYWQSNGGLAQQGYPISGEFVEKSDLDGKEYRVQYFERAVFELHPENQPPYDVLLSQLGRFRFQSKYPAGEPGTSATPGPGPTATVATAGPFDAAADATAHPSALPPANLSPIFGRAQAGTEKRECVESNSHVWVRSGEFVAGPFDRYVREWEPNMREGLGKIMWYPLHREQMRGLRVRAIQLETSTIAKTYNFTTVAYHEQGEFYPSGVTLPTAGRWRLVVTSGPDWGCFDLDLKRET